MEEGSCPVLICTQTELRVEPWVTNTCGGSCGACVAFSCLLLDTKGSRLAERTHRTHQLPLLNICRRQALPGSVRHSACARRCLRLPPTDIKQWQLMCSMGFSPPGEKPGTSTMPNRTWQAAPAARGSRAGPLVLPD